MTNQPLETIAKQVAAEPVARRTIPVQSRRLRIPRHLQAAAAILIAISLISSLVLYNQPDEPYRLLFQPSPDDSAGDFNYGGNAGHTWNFGDVAPLTSQSLQQTSADLGLVFSGFGAFVVNDSLIIQRFTGNMQELIRFDLEFQSVIWSEKYPIDGPLASDGKRIFGISTLASTGIRSSQLLAIDFETGGVTWMGPTVAGRGAGSASLILMDNVVFVADFLGNIVAVDPESGSTIWTSPKTIQTPTADETMDVNGTPPNLAASLNGLFVAYSNGEISRFDVSTGQKLHTYREGTATEEERLYISLAVSDRHVFARITHVPDVAMEIHVNLLALDPQSLEILTQNTVDSTMSNIVLLSDRAYFATTIEPDQAVRVMSMNLESGELSNPIDDVAGDQHVFLSASGNMWMVTTDRSEVAFIDANDRLILFREELSVESSSTSPIPFPALLWNETPVVISADGIIHGFFPSLVMSGTPVPAHHGTSGETYDSPVLAPG